MRFLHTGDWHVGKTLRGRARIEEYAAALEEVVGIAQQEGVDAVLLAGDVYEQRTPVPEADEIVFECFVRLHEAGIPLVIIPGNHDAAIRLGAIGKLVKPLGVHIAPKIARPEDGGVIEVPNRAGDEAMLVACMPFIPERHYGDAAELFESAAKWHQGYADGVGALLDGFATTFRPDRVNVVLAHLFATGAQFGGGEREVSITINYAVPPSRLPGTASYIALGHIHKPQNVPGAPAPTRYPGSLIQLDFGEVDQSKSVTIVDAKAGTPAKVREVGLTAGRKLMDLHGTLDELRARADSIGDAFVRATVVTDGPVPGIADQVRDFLPNALQVTPAYERAEDTERGERLASLKPRDQFLSYHRSVHGSEPHETLLAAFDEVLSGVGEED
jgi:DNA repair protein SbcD/Mre11